MPLSQKINAAILVFILSFAYNIVFAQEADPKRPEYKISERINFIQTSFDKGQTTAEADLESSESIISERINFIQASFDKGQTSAEADLKSSESIISERINFIQTSFDKGQTSAKIWSYTWVGVNGAAAVAQTYQAISSGRNRVSNIVGASESFLGLAVLIVYPFRARSSGNDLREIPGDTPEELKDKLDKAESWLERNYKQEKLGRSWLAHLGVFALGIIGAGVIWHYEGRKNSIINGLATIVGGELQIWTQPTRGIRNYNEYHNKYKDAYNGPPEKKYFIAPSRNGFIAGIYF